jgi:hypothetical protein
MADLNFSDYSIDELEKLLADYRASNDRGRCNWKIQQIEGELVSRKQDITIAMDADEKLLIVRSPDNRIGEVVAPNWDEGAIA